MRNTFANTRRNLQVTKNKGETKENTLMERRMVRFHNFDELLADVDNLREKGYDKAGNWDLAHICNHLSGVMEMSLDGFPKKFPWVMRVMARLFFLKTMLDHKPTKQKFNAPDYLQPSDSNDDDAACERIRAVVERLKSYSGPMQPSPIFGKLTPEEWREVHLWHAEHHLSFLLPKVSETAS